MIFWYPGEAGSTADAQASIDLFFDYINKHIAPDRMTGKYFNTVSEGLEFIRSAKPAFGIISFAAYTINTSRLADARPLLYTLPLPEGKQTEIYTIVGRGGRTGVLYTKQPLTKDFVSRYILNDTMPDLKINVVQNIFPVLKDISAGTITGGAILQPMEYHTLRNIDQPWARELKVWATSQPVPSAPFVVFGEQKLAPKIKDILIRMTTDPVATDILQTLRFKGFAEPKT